VAPPRKLLPAIVLAYLGLHHVEFTCFHYSITCTYFLLHLSSPRDGRALPATLPCGVQTFLPSWYCYQGQRWFPLLGKCLM